MTCATDACSLDAPQFLVVCLRYHHPCYLPKRPNLCGRSSTSVLQIGHSIPIPFSVPILEARGIFPLFRLFDHLEAILKTEEMVNLMTMIIIKSFVVDRASEAFVRLLIDQLIDISEIQRSFIACVAHGTRSPLSHKIVFWRFRKLLDETFDCLLTVFINSLQPCHSLLRLGGLWAAP